MNANSLTLNNNIGLTAFSVLLIKWVHLYIFIFSPQRRRISNKLMNCYTYNHFFFKTWGYLVSPYKYKKQEKHNLFLLKHLFYITLSQNTPPKNRGRAFTSVLHHKAIPPPKRISALFFSLSYDLQEIGSVPRSDSSSILGLQIHLIYIWSGQLY